MGTTFDGLDEGLVAWIRQQHLFFVATAPLAADGLLNCSPKGLDSFAVIDPHTVVYADLNGSGIETAAHLRENGRIVVMFCALEGPPRILRLSGVGEYLLPDHADFETLSGQFSLTPLRGLVRIRLRRIADSCGYGVPRFDYRGQRETLVKWGAGKSPEAMREYQREHNRLSLDGLPGIDFPDTGDATRNR